MTVLEHATFEALWSAFDRTLTEKYGIEQSARDRAERLAHFGKELGQAAGAEAPEGRQRASAQQLRRWLNDGTLFRLGEVLLRDLHGASALDLVEFVVVLARSAGSGVACLVATGNGVPLALCFGFDGKQRAGHRTAPEADTAETLSARTVTAAITQLQTAGLVVPSSVIVRASSGLATETEDARWLPFTEEARRVGELALAAFDALGVPERFDSLSVDDRDALTEVATNLIRAAVLARRRAND